jgi:predicted DNA-binding transcriptional regulator
MHIALGILMAIIGLFLAVSATLRSNIVIYRLLVARSRMLWRDRVHQFYQVVGVILVLLGVLWASGVIWREM